MEKKGGTGISLYNKGGGGGIRDGDDNTMAKEGQASAVEHHDGGDGDYNKHCGGGQGEKILTIGRTRIAKIIKINNIIISYYYPTISYEPS